MESMMWISCSAHPLKADELCHALAVEVGTTDLTDRPQYRQFPFDTDLVELHIRACHT